jgi:hypothetical protein
VECESYDTNKVDQSIGFITFLLVSDVQVYQLLTLSKFR